MISLDEKLSKQFPGVRIETGAVIGERCRIDAGCELSAGTRINQQVVLCANVHILGDVQIDTDVNIRDNVTLIGPLHIQEVAYISHDTTIGTERTESLGNRRTIIGEKVRIGKSAEIIAGVTIGNGARIRANSKVIGDVPVNGLVSRSPAILEGYICPNCGARLQIREAHHSLIYTICNRCHFPPTIMTIQEWAKTPNHVLLPDHQIGEEVSTMGDDPRWLDEWETR